MLKSTLYFKENNNTISKVEDIKADNIEDLMEELLNVIAVNKGRKFYYNMAQWFFKKYDAAINTLSSKRKFEFTEDIWVILN